MKKVLAIVFIAALFASCSREKKVVEEEFPDGKPKRVCTYVGRGENRQIIHETTYYSSGQMRMDGSYKNNKRDGQWIYWYENGSKWSEGFFKEGKNEGKRLTYFENGKPRYEAWYKDGARVGKWKFFNEAGNLLKEVDYSLPADSVKE